MGLDILARAAASAADEKAIVALADAASAAASAQSASLAAGNALAAATPVDLFQNLSGKTIEPAVNLIVTTGYSTPGNGQGVYICDSQATAQLAAAHPRFCKQSANGRYFRLISTDAERSLSVAQGGASGTAGVNDQPAIQATIAYAVATRHRWVVFPEPAYELWCPIRTGSPTASAAEGYPIVITTTDGLGLRGSPGGTTLNFRNSLGGSKNTITQVVSGQNWQGGGIFVLPGGAWPPVAADWFSMENLTLDGGVTYNPADRSNTNLSDKGLRIQDTTCRRVSLRNCTLKNFAGEIYYVNGNIDLQLLENVTLDGSPQSALNPAGKGKFFGINVQAGNSYQACEVLGGLGFTMVGGRLYDCYTSVVFGGPDGSWPAGFPYFYPVRQNTKRPPWVQFIGTRFEGFTDSVYFGSWIQGSIVTVDTAVVLNASVGYLRDINLEIEAWNDLKSAYAAVRMTGPATLSTQLGGAPAGTYITPPTNIRVTLKLKRTEQAMVNARSFSTGVLLSPGLYDKSNVVFSVSGEATLVYSVSANPPANFAVPRIDYSNFSTLAQPYGGNYDFPTGDRTYDVAWSALAIVPPAGTMNVSLGGTYGYADGQKVIFYHKDAVAGKIINFPADGPNHKLQRDRKLYILGDFLELRYDATIRKWVEERYITSTRLIFAGSAPYDAPELAPGASATTTITVAGAALGDQVLSVALDTSALGLILTGYVSAANTVTVVLFNPGPAAVNLPAATLSASVQKK